ncbi:phosphate ABC transporter substrate-binding protein PstS [Ursidibacter maritimus]|uniref:Phosphate-binding protein PstS n=1 Tax=Ursidibacter maritimus TaxID=1331689 RepID=A0A949T808_9PAST|nr:phosphate ABC transporter substrate-binding protein PstS [Ursidibacter maritimus]KAE9540177.1 phosphate ABC transporter substrate-binding protein [Ursidibacter maritimus]MBV6523774.1 phosphate ABC transporter substrate-binding protein PstS [Ursidibacter maritimus]MBV6526399.1 phosphate ABC transporter substrate-binding protein PstS [Ursidibacter maritimus]MBV6527870.1 phosphate ABC transporter substrate-binding protein PstS [Ursidibacter maritimus]MBV6529177.1 phosphate ABC transporter subs
MLSKVFKPLAVLGLSFAMIQSANAETITGAGASFPYPIYAKWAGLYEKETANKVNYQSIGSGGGQQQIIAKTIDFGASDDPMKAQALADNQLLQFPAIIGGTVPVVNIPEVKSGELKLSGAVLADIFLGKIQKWNDPAISKLNQGIALPEKNILVVRRSDGSGTTFGWTNYLSKISPEWKEKVGEGKSVKWPVGQGGKGNEGVAAYVKQLKYSIGYVEYAYAKQNELSWVSLQNADGKFVQPSRETFAAAAANAKWDSAAGMGVILTNEVGEQSWPITAASFILIHKNSEKPEQTKSVFKFFEWAFEHGKKSASELDYVPLPDNVVEQIKAQWKNEVKDKQGKAIY